MKYAFILSLLASSAVTACALESHSPENSTKNSVTASAVKSLAETNMTTALRVFETLASDEMQGRATGTAGARKAKTYLKSEIKALNIFDQTSEQNFSFLPYGSDSDIEGTNLIGVMDADDQDEGPLLVITAHYDHLGEHKGKIYNGADDNASGSAALFAIAESFAKQPPQHDIAFIWLDAEEHGLSGAKAYVMDENQFGNRPVFNLNLDMISQNENEIYFAGSHHLPILKSLIAQASQETGIILSFGHDRPSDGSNDWTLQSDHGVFHKAGIPFGYFGVEDHPHYHKPSDTFDTIPQEFYKSAVHTIINAAHILDENLEALAKPAIREKD